MSDEHFRQQIQAIHQQMAVLHDEMMRLSPSQPKQVAEVLEEIAAAFDNLQLIYERMQTRLEVATVVEEELLEQNQRAIAERQHYYDLFQFSPNAYLVTDTNGIILEANGAIAKLLQIPQNYLPGKPFAVFIPQNECSSFRTRLNQLSGVNEIQNWEINLCPKRGEPFVARLNIAIARNEDGAIETLRIGVYDVSESKKQAQATTPFTLLPHTLDGLQVLVVDDEADTREFITAVLESSGIRVTAVASAAEALETLEQFRPNVLLSDIRMPELDGYSLIRQVRALEARQGGHIPAVAMTAYLDEDREKTLAAGFEAHLHKMVQPSEWIEMVAQLARQASSPE